MVRTCKADKNLSMVIARRIICTSLSPHLPATMHTRGTAQRYGQVHMSTYTTYKWIQEDGKSIARRTKIREEEATSTFKGDC